MAAGTAFDRAGVLPFMVAICCCAHVGSVGAETYPDGGGDVELVGCAAFGASEAELVAEFFGDFDVVVVFGTVEAGGEVDAFTVGIVA